MNFLLGVAMYLGWTNDFPLGFYSVKILIVHCAVQTFKFVEHVTVCCR